LQPSSIRQALTILSALFSYLSEAGYRRGNPFKLVRQRQTRIHSPWSAFSTSKAWQAILARWQTAHANPPRTATSRPRPLAD
jgi:site-specific recombinase XerD